MTTVKEKVAKKAPKNRKKRVAPKPLSPAISEYLTPEQVEALKQMVATK